MATAKKTAAKKLTATAQRVAAKKAAPAKKPATKRLASFGGAERLIPKPIKPAR